MSLERCGDHNPDRNGVSRANSEVFLREQKACHFFMAALEHREALLMGVDHPKLPWILEAEIITLSVELIDGDLEFLELAGFISGDAAFKDGVVEDVGLAFQEGNGIGQGVWTTDEGT
jgi:hypothetical protein